MIESRRTFGRCATRVQRHSGPTVNESHCLWVLGVEAADAGVSQLHRQYVISYQQWSAGGWIKFFANRVLGGRAIDSRLFDAADHLIHHPNQLASCIEPNDYSSKLFGYGLNTDRPEGHPARVSVH